MRKRGSGEGFVIVGEVVTLGIDGKGSLMCIVTVSAHFPFCRPRPYYYPALALLLLLPFHYVYYFYIDRIPIILQSSIILIIALVPDIILFILLITGSAIF